MEKLKNQGFFKTTCSICQQTPGDDFVVEKKCEICQQTPGDDVTKD